MRSKPDSRQHMKSEVLLLAMYNFPQLVRIARHANVALSPGAERTGGAEQRDGTQQDGREQAHESASGVTGRPNRPSRWGAGSSRRVRTLCETASVAAEQSEGRGWREWQCAGR